ncbi:DnaD domain protein [Porcipelethomonas sp.]|uniref:DnaD domain-containing protein n=1 Tax=Porcipelethomonas sp. TaxID=2981675 RepID=UPI003EF8D4FD
MEYFLNTGCFGSVFAVPKSIVDNYIKLANEASIKVLLYMLRYNEQEHSAQKIASALNISVEQVEEAFLFWENANIFSRNNSEMESLPVVEPAEKETPKKARSVPAGRQNFNMNPSEIAERVEKSEEIKCLFLMAEESFGRPLNHTEQRIFIWIHDYLGLSTDVILMLTAYCISVDKGNIKYIETIAADWNEREINTLEAAQKEIKRLEEYGSFNSKIMKAFGMNRKPTSKQQEYIDSWKAKNYSIELIQYAYEKTIEAIDKLNFPYINKILENWYQNGLVTKELIDGNKKNSPAKTEEKNYSFDLNDIKSLVNNFGD